MNTYHLEYKKHTDSEWETYTTKSKDSNEAYNNFYKEVGHVSTCRLKDIVEGDTIRDSSQYDVASPLIFIILFVIIMHLILR